MAVLVDLLIGDSNLMLHFSESKTRIPNSTKVSSIVFSEFVTIYVFVSMCNSKLFLRIVAIIIQGRRRWQLFCRH